MSGTVGANMTESLKGNQRLLKGITHYSRSKSLLNKKNAPVSKLTKIPNKTKREIRRENTRNNVIRAIIIIGFFALLCFCAYLLL
jgi:hypothetical protein